MNFCDDCHLLISDYAIHQCPERERLTMYERELDRLRALQRRALETETPIFFATQQRGGHAETGDHKTPYDLSWHSLPDPQAWYPDPKDLVGKEIRVNVDPSRTEDHLQKRIDQLLQQHIGPASSAAASWGMSTADAGSAMHELIAAMRSPELTEEEARMALGFWDGLGALGAVLSRRPKQVDCRLEVIDKLREYTGQATKLEPWQSGAMAAFGTSIVLDPDLEPGTVRVHSQDREDPLNLTVTTTLIVIGDL